jgi:hypothetical protein
MPVLGMSRFIDPTIPPRHLRNLEHRIAPSSPATAATTHGNIGDDAKTHAPVSAHIQGRPIPLP